MGKIVLLSLLIFISLLILISCSSIVFAELRSCEGLETGDCWEIETQEDCENTCVEYGNLFVPCVWNGQYCVYGEMFDCSEREFYDGLLEEIDTLELCEAVYAFDNPPWNEQGYYPGLWDGLYNFCFPEDMPCFFVPEVNISTSVLCDPTCYPDFESLGEIKYSDVFPPRIRCSVFVSDFDSEENDEIQLAFNFTAGHPLRPHNKTLYLTTINCQNNNTCSVDLPLDSAKNVLPEEAVDCKVTPKDKDNVVGKEKSSGVNMPSFDLYINNISVSNVIEIQPGENIPLIANKPFVISIQPFFKSDIITEMDIPVDIFVNYTFVEQTLFTSFTRQFKPMKEFDKNEVKQRVIQNKNDPDYKDINILTKIKKGEDKLNVLQITPPNSSGTVEIYAEIDIDDEFNESYDGEDFKNNNGGVFQVIETKSITLLPVCVVIEDRPSDISQPPRATYYPSNIGCALTTKNIVKKGAEALKELYPVDPNEIEILDVDFMYIDKDFSIPPSNVNFRIDKSLNGKIIRMLQKKAEEAGADYAVGVLNFNFGKTSSGANRGECKPYASKNAVILYGPDTTNLTVAPTYASLTSVKTLSHEIGHLNGIKAGVILWDYLIGEAGRAGADGFVIDQKTGKIKEIKINIWKESGDLVLVKDTFDQYIEGVNIFHKTLIYGTFNAFFNLDLLSLKGDSGVYITKEQYIKLINAFKEEEDD